MDNVLYVPIQINGMDGNTLPGAAQLLERELFVLQDGKLYVGVKDGDSVKAVSVVGNVIPNAIIERPILNAPIINSATLGEKLTVDEGLIYSPDATLPTDAKEGQVVFIDMGKHQQQS